MLNSKTLLVAIVAFVLGISYNEFRHYLLEHREIFISAKNDSVVSIDASSSISSDASIEAATEVATTEAAVSESIDVKPDIQFSWQRVNQLISDAHYDDAIHLLQTQLGNTKNAAQAWNVLAQVYKKQAQPIAALDAWFRSLKLELNAQKIDQMQRDIKTYLAQLKETPALFNEDYSWLISQYDELLKYMENDGELHVIMASLYLKLNDSYQAQYHALMAVSDPRVQKQAEDILAKLNGEKPIENINIPLVVAGNQYIVNATVEGYPVRLLLDTGASLSGLSSSYIAKYPFMVKDTKPILLNTASGTQKSFLFTVNNIFIGSLVFNQHILAQLPMGNAGGFDGLLGVDILGRFDFVIDQDAAMLRLKARKK